MGCEVTPATCQLGMSPVEYTEMPGETDLAAAGDAIDASAEARETVWCPIEQLPEYHVDEVLLSGVERAIPAGSQ